MFKVFFYNFNNFLYFILIDGCNIIIRPYTRILDFDWLIAGVFSYLGLISFILAAAAENDKQKVLFI